MTHSRRVALLVAVGLVVALGAGWWGTARAAVSPAQRLADASVKPAPMVTGTAEESALVDGWSSDGTIKQTVSVPVMPPPAAEGAFANVITRTPKWPKPLKAPFVVAEVSSTPVVVIPGTTPFYRPIKRDDSGPDVDELLATIYNNPQPEGTPFTVYAEGAFVTWWQALGLDVSIVKDKKGKVTVPTRLLTVVPSGQLSSSKAPKEGDSVEAETPIVTLTGGAAAAIVELEAGSNIAVEPGMKATITVDGKDHPATVAKVTQSADKAGKLVVTPTKALSTKNGATVSVTVALDGTTSKVLNVPISAVHRQGDGSMYVEVVDGSARKRIPIEIGRTVGARVEVTSGDLKAGDAVALPVENP